MWECSRGSVFKRSSTPQSRPHPFTTRLPHGMEGVNLLKHYTFIFYSSGSRLPGSPDSMSFQPINLNLFLQKSCFTAAYMCVSVWTVVNMPQRGHLRFNSSASRYGSSASVHFLYVNTFSHLFSQSD